MATKKVGVELDFSILDDGFKEEIKKMNTSLSSMRKELNLVDEELKGSGVSVENYQKKLDNLRQQEEESRRKVEETRKAYEKAKEILGENSKEASKYKDKLTEAEMQHKKITNAIDNTTKSLEEYEEELKQNEKKNRELNSTLGQLTSTISNQKEQLEDLKKQYISTVLEQGKGSTKAKELKSSIQNLNGEIKQNEEKISDAEKELQDFSSAEDKAGQHAITFGEMIKANLISEAIKKGLSELVNLAKQLGNTLLNVGKQALESFGDYEQLLGGVETLFGTQGAKSVEEYAKLVGKSVDEVREKFDILSQSQNDVVKNANDAYKTSGMSANQYMETVTSFSASLLQSLNGDTIEAARVADMAIIDMSDNANKMGTNIQNIQNAYQGFAKQNYTMLDNLKLGYGGTKTEMERLLVDAEKISGIHYDINSLNDVYNAIHIIQGKLGITGTTAQEASTTIQGSVNSMKSAWQNMLTGIADENSNFEQLVNNLVESLVGSGDGGGVLNNILPRIEIILNGISNLIVAFADKILPKVLEIGINTIKNLVNGITNNLPQIVTVALQVITLLINTILDILPQILELGIELVVELVNGIAEIAPTLIPQIVETMLKLFMIITSDENLQKIMDAGVKLLFALIEGLIESLPKLLENGDATILAFINIMSGGNLLMAKLGIALLKSLISGLIDMIPGLKDKALEIKDAVINSIQNGISKISEVGTNLVKALWNGISGSLQWIKNKINSWVGNVLDFIKKLFGIHSPSTVFRDEIGTNLALGIGVGFTDEMQDVAEEMQNAIPKNFDVDVGTNVLNNNFDDNASVSQNNRSITDTSDYNPGQVAPIYLTIEHFENNREQDIEDLSEELAYFQTQVSYGRGTA